MSGFVENQMANVEKFPLIHACSILLQTVKGFSECVVLTKSEELKSEVYAFESNAERFTKKFEEEERAHEELQI